MGCASDAATLFGMRAEGTRGAEGAWRAQDVREARARGCERLVGWSFSRRWARMCGDARARGLGRAGCAGHVEVQGVRMGMRGGRERLRARARGARGSRLKFCLVRQTSTGALARGRRVRGCARAGHVGAQGERGHARAGASGWPDGRSLGVRRAGLHNSFAVLLAASKGLRTAETARLRLSSEQTVKGFSILFCSWKALSLQ